MPVSGVIENILKCVHVDPIEMNQHHFRWWLGAVREQSIAWSNSNQYLQWHMLSQDQNEFNQILTHLYLNI